MGTDESACTPGTPIALDERSWPFADLLRTFCGLTSPLWTVLGRWWISGGQGQERVLAASTGLRQGEALGLTVDRVDFLRRTATVDRQLVLLPGREPYLAPPKTEASMRMIPLTRVAIEALAAHLAAFPTGTRSSA